MSIIILILSYVINYSIVMLNPMLHQLLLNYIIIFNLNLFNQ